MYRSLFFIIKLIIIGSLVSKYTYAQELSNKSNRLFIQPEWMIGKVVPNYKIAPATTLGQAFIFNVGFQSSSKKNSWPVFYNHPITGLQFIINNTGNDQVYGNEFSMVPYFMFKPLPDHLNNTYLKSGLGLSYFTKPYEPELNPGNKSIGSHYTWSFELSAHHFIRVNQHFDVSLGAGYRHASNGHIQLPNLGLNTAVLSVGLRYGTKTSPFNVSNSRETSGNAAKQTFIYYRQGVGVHELGSARGPVGGKKNTVYASSLGWSILLKTHIRIRTGLTYRFYSHYYEQAKLTETSGPEKTPVSQASNIFYFLGTEFLIGHFAIDIEGGINLYKPYYKTFYNTYERKTSTLWYTLKSTFPSRLGIKYYLVNTEKKTLLNGFVGAHINANFGQADFSEFSIGILYSLKP